VRAEFSGIWGAAGAALSVLAVGAGPAHAQDFDQLSEADTTMQAAIDAAEAGDWAEARRLAEIVLALDDSYATAPARSVLVQALENEGSLRSALYEARRYLELELKPDRRETGERIERRLTRLVEGGGTAVPTRSAKGPGIGLLIGGAAPIVAGGWFLGTDIQYAAQGTDSGTWAAIGTPMLITGAALEVVGAVLIGQAGKESKAAAGAIAPVPTASYDPASGQWLLGVSGRF